MKAFITTLLLVCSTLVSNPSLSQEYEGALELPEMNILYRGYPNKVVAAVTNNDGCKIELIGSGCTITKTENSNLYIVKPGSGKSAYITLALVDGDSSIAVRKMEYRVSNLPDPEIYWGGVKSGGTAATHQQVLFAKYPPEIPLNAQFSISEWTMITKTDTCSGKGSNISTAEAIFREINEPTLIEFEVIVVGPDGIQRRKRGTFKVNKWVEPEREFPPVGCG
jgi:hypothetical protein